MSASSLKRSNAKASGGAFSQDARQTSRIAVRRGRYLRRFAYRFIELCMPELTEALVKGAVASGDGSLQVPASL